ncbi:FkbM family methyltransferase [bacterium]|nr:FkbM family methyltransferase [bacterium]
MKTVHKIFLARLAYRLVSIVRGLLRRSPVTVVKRHGISWQLDLREGIDFAIYLQGHFEPQTAKALSKFVEPGQTVVDIGANIGAHTLPLAKLVGASGRVIAFEPTQYAYQKLLTNVRLNPELSEQVIAEQIMLGTENIEHYQAEIYSSWTIAGRAKRHPKHLGELKPTEGCAMRTLDSYLTEKGSSEINLIKLDVDGHECRVLLGAIDVLKYHRPIICFELSPYVLLEHNSSVDELMSIFHRSRYLLLSERGKLLPQTGNKLSELVGDGEGINAFAVPVERKTIERILQS